MRWLQTEYLLKGVYLGLVLFAALLLSDAPKDAVKPSLLQFNLATLGGLAAALVLAAVLKVRAGYRPGRGLGQYLLYLMLESPTLIYAGILGGAGVGNRKSTRLNSSHLVISY